ncbi:transcriptional regulator [Burkholderia pseudomallei]|uniref:transcriptional regulator n=1 Tax=Burkholderia pseudomallei TaxID=28450 RepID=UPI000F04E811|nr:YdaS family helix-turn-helix protein [Burkholderia pseudomallei]MBD2953671.1 helix-turn-helix domain-containing protein [Burkholderia pseudomallei]MBD2972064.1 helix-turn-helix domain-containing protein [Burkholderia pseudomallei]MCW0024674.1 helix-turn-helix domain-containing protein [Burkholderia pseudomallei]MCW0156023.1 helix-turn-helix domain-containing protein [Burkholderia pseudomallei]MCW0169549.1 helix-turn-helix domain-containing protein [Burkholderia pseudomallei]
MDLRIYLDGERGRLVKLAKTIGAHASDISAWANRRRPVPVPFGWSIERATGGAVRRCDLFPIDVIRDIWPELTQQNEVTT